MNTPVRPLDDVTQETICRLTREMGAAAALRFLDQVESGSGNYTGERHALLGNPSVDEFFAQVRRREAARKG